MDSEKTYVRHCMRYEFAQGHSAAAAARNICGVVGEGTVSERTCNLWFCRFRCGDYSIDDRPRSGRPSECDVDELRRLVESDPRQTTRCLASLLGCTHGTVERHLHLIGKVYKYGSWVPHHLTQRDLDLRSDVCTNLLSKSRHFFWLDQVVTGDEKWVLYVHHTRKRQWLGAEEKGKPDVKGEIHERKVLLSVWWDVRGVIWYELLPPNTTVTADYYCLQLDRLNSALIAARPQLRKIYMLHDNARPHTAKVTRQKLLSFGWQVLPHPPYSPDIAPTDYHLFRSLQHHLEDKEYDDQQQLDTDIRTFFASKPGAFYRDGIHQLPTRWRHIVDTDGAYYTG